YRQMPAVIERGYLYIAQPPLFKVKKGSSERYLKNESDLTEYLLGAGLENYDVASALNAKDKSNLRQITGRIQKFDRLLKSLSASFDPDFLQFLASRAEENGQILSNREVLQKTLDTMKTELRTRHAGNELTDISFDIADDPEHGCFKAIVKTVRNAVTTT